MNNDYKLIHRKVVPFKHDLFNDVVAWAKEHYRYNGNKRRNRVRKTYRGDDYVSTVFLGFDHGINPDKPLLFETMVFGGKYDHEIWRCHTWREALKQHRAMVKIAFS